MYSSHPPGHICATVVGSWGLLWNPHSSCLSHPVPSWPFPVRTRFIVRARVITVEIISLNKQILFHLKKKTPGKIIIIAETPILSLDTPIFSSETPIFSLKAPKVLHIIGTLNILVGDSTMEISNENMGVLMKILRSPNENIGVFNEYNGVSN